MSQQQPKKPNAVRTWNRFFAGESGLAAIEFGILGPILALLVVGTCDLGLGLYDSMQVEAAAQAGAQYAAANGFNASAISNAVTGAGGAITIAASPAPTENCGCPDGTGVGAAVCGSTCPDGNVAGVYVTVSAASNYTTLIPYPTLPQSFSLASTAMVRIQ